MWVYEMVDQQLENESLFIIHHRLCMLIMKDTPLPCCLYPKYLLLFVDSNPNEVMVPGERTPACRSVCLPISGIAMPNMLNWGVHLNCQPGHVGSDI